MLNPSLAADLVPFQPTTAREFRATDVLRLFARVSWKPASSGNAGVGVTIDVPDSDVQQSTTLGGTAAKDGRLEATLDTTLPLTGLGPGTYVLEIAVQRPGVEPGVKRQVVFEIK